MAASERYVSAAGRSWLTGLYDPVMALTMRERAFRPALLAAVMDDPRPTLVLDLGCGTGTFASQLARVDPCVRIEGIDGDEDVLARARLRSTQHGDRVHLTKGLANALPFEDGSFDVVTASLLLHHLTTPAKLEALAEARRVLRPGGRLVIADWGLPPDPLTRAGFFALQLLDGFENTRDHAAGRLPSLIERAGFSDVSIKQHWRTIWGSLELIVAHAGSA